MDKYITIKLSKERMHSENAKIKFGKLANKNYLARTAIKVVFNNQTSVDVTRAEVTVSDDSTPGTSIVRKLQFGRIATGTSQLRTTTLPTGIEKVFIKFYVEGDNQPYTRVDFGDNVKLIGFNLTE